MKRVDHAYTTRQLAGIAAKYKMHGWARAKNRGKDKLIEHINDWIDRRDGVRNL